MPFKVAPLLFSGLGQLENHRQQAGARDAARRLGRAAAPSRRSSQSVRGAEPVLREKLIKRQ